MTKQELMTLAAEVEGRRRNRRITEDDAQKAIDLIESGLYKSITVYAEHGSFVSNTYKYRAPMSVIHAHLTENGWIVNVGTADAKRRYGRGAWATAVSIDHADGAYRGVA